MKKILLIFCVLLSLSSCGFFDSGFFKDDNNIFNQKTRTFWAYNFTEQKDYTLQADLLAEGRFCKVWAERGKGIKKNTAENLANIYDSNIYVKMTDTFSIKNFSFGDEGTAITFSNIMEYADWLSDGDGKLCILLLDIIDNYKPGVNDSTISGYFRSLNFFDVRYSNLCDMIYIDTYPGTPGSKTSNITIAHEMQHLMNFVTSVVYRDSIMDLWIDEGLSSAAEWVYSGEHSEDRWRWYNTDPSGLINKGNNFFVWNNRENENQYAVLDDYATVYLFFQWLRLQTGSSGIYREIISSKDHDHNAVINAFNAAIQDTDYSSWKNVLLDWLAANYINSPNNRYGYKNDPVLKQIKAHAAPSGRTRISLAPGEGVYSTTNHLFDKVPEQGQVQVQFIRYAFLNNNADSAENVRENVYTDAFFPGGALLTYNTNDNFNGSAERGFTTGIAASVDNSPKGRSISPFGPYRIGARDLEE